MSRAYLVYKPVLKALCLGHQLLRAAISVARGGRVPNQIPVIHLKNDRLDQTCTAMHALLNICQTARPPLEGTALVTVPLML